ncbi:hypothetical protein [Flavobacterium aquatile]|uniref:Uncharacterized protein n=1 Tax=Flavobacterium aquatile LMG 4008 = ATCC 11947 TaxID=1453498 RepID=A0A095SVB8_9FLAO|nr:hypothetical protein [Flavobacterium aquatile]KGD68339.1 hypothetical protein LG45_08610 [Flavobacterium aquatile LMG 4008 = ATCC 11947]OXA68728.1 hypothetical protein B0A61_03200 [Flavobacterium aquatile LMG 4008 = ATCC 11947]GEC77180.1 hypothetical protein FAQ01_00500 [Flavobacterium aquatile]
MILQSDVLTNATNKQRNLFIGIAFDLIGMLTYLIPIFGEVGDVIWAPIAGFMLSYLYKGSIGKVSGVLGFLEEILPFSDFIPTFTLTWIYTYVIKNQNNN